MTMYEQLEALTDAAAIEQDWSFQLDMVAKAADVACDQGALSWHEHTCLHNRIKRARHARQEQAA